MATQEAAFDSRAKLSRAPSTFETIVIGGGQAGLSVGYHLKQQGRPFVILDANEQIGDSWRTRTWDSLRLFTPARYDGLPGMAFPAPGWSFPDGARDGRLPRGLRGALRPAGADRHARDSPGEGRRPVRRRVRRAAASRPTASSSRRASTASRRCRTLPPSSTRASCSCTPASTAILPSCAPAACSSSAPGTPAPTSRSRCRATHRTWLSGRDKGQVPVPIEHPLRRLFVPMLWFVASHVLTMKTPIGRKVRPHVLEEGAPLIRVKSRTSLAAGVERVAQTAGVRDGLPLLEDGRVLDVANVIWCTGFRQDFSWIDLPVFGEDGEPVHERGVASRAGPVLRRPGLPVLVHLGERRRRGEGRRHIAKHIAAC